LILPWFGGSAAVWTTCMLFFQVLLLGGYAYAHALNAKLRGRGQAIVHTLLLAAAVACLPIAPAESWKPAGGDEPVSRIRLLLAATGSVLLLAVTNHLTQNVASVPLLWLAPLTLYLLSFILTFEGRGWYRPEWLWWLLLLWLGAMAWLLVDSDFNFDLPVQL